MPRRSRLLLVLSAILAAPIPGTVSGLLAQEHGEVEAAVASEPEESADSAATARRTPRVVEPTYDTDGYETRTALRLPFAGEWWVFWGGRTRQANYHRASALQRYAYDFAVWKGGSTHRGAGTANEDYWCWGRPILAPAAGAVVVAVDGIPENVPGELNAEQKLGNHVVLDHANGEFSLLAHLRTGSVAVEQGDTVASGDPLGACGNSGNSTEAHLHYQLQTGPDFFESTAIPAPFRGYRANGAVVEIGEPVRGETIAPLSDESTDR